MLRKIASILILLVFSTGVTAQSGTSGSQTVNIDQRSYNLGTFAAFCEVVSLGIKQMALSAATTSAEMDSLVNEANRIAEEQHVQVYREPDFLVTDLFPESATLGKHVLIIYQGPTLDRYLALKEKKATLVEAGSYSDDARRDVAWELGKLLSYPDEKIAALIEKNTGTATSG